VSFWPYSTVSAGASVSKKRSSDNSNAPAYEQGRSYELELISCVFNTPTIVTEYDEPTFQSEEVAKVWRLYKKLLAERIVPTEKILCENGVSGSILAQMMDPGVVVRNAGYYIRRINECSRQKKQAELVEKFQQCIRAGTDPAPILKQINELQQQPAIADRTDEDGAKLADDLVDYYRQYVRVGEDEYSVLALWVLHCHTFKACSRTPYLNVNSPAPACGKTVCLEATELLVPNPLMASSLSNNVLGRAIEELHPALLLDEVDQLQAGDKVLFAAVEAVINSGYKKSGSRIILVPVKGGGWELKRLSTFCPKMLSGISTLPAVLLSRCIPINMQRMEPGDRVAEIDEFVTEPEAARLKERCKRWAQAHLNELQLSRPDWPAGLGHRQREVSRPLFAIGDLIGGAWPGRIREAVVRLFTTRDSAPSSDIKTELLRDIKDVFGNGDRIASKALVEGLAQLEDRPWAAWGRSGKPINQNQLASQVKDFHIYPGTIRLEDGTTPKGYYRKHFEPVWLRYTPSSPPAAATPPRPASLLGKTQLSASADGGSETSENPSVYAPCGGVAGTATFVAATKSEESSMFMRVVADTPKMKGGKVLGPEEVL
jgi:Protein of unknown function (DUF3631)